jgi:hypothetical protein
VSHARTVRTLAACGVLLAAGVSGCTDTSARPKPLPSPSPSSSVASPTPSPSATPPSLPAEARGTSAAAAKAFVRYWVEVLNHAGATGNTAQLDEVSDDNCRSCQAVIRSIDEAYRAGGYFRGNGWSVETLQPQPFQTKTRPVLSAGVHIAPQDVLRREGGKVTHFEGGQRSMLFRLQWAGGHWTVLQVDQTS